MMGREKILGILHQLGFQPEFVDENIGYRFEYEGMILFFTPEDDDAHTIYLMAPCIFDVTDENRVAVLETMSKFTRQMKFVQPVIFLNSVWLNYQHFLDKYDPTPELLEHMIRGLAVSTVKFHKFINNEEDDE